MRGALQMMLLGTAPAGGGVEAEYTGITWSQSTVYGGLAATAANMRDDNSITPQTGGGTNFSLTPEYILADLGSAKTVTKITLGGGSLAGWGGVAAYANGKPVQYSNDGSTWTTVFTTSGITDSAPRDKDFAVSPPVSARYWRISTSPTNGYIATCTFRLYGTD